MGHKLWFRPVAGCDIVSATANPHGFTPLISVARHFNWSYELLDKAAAACNARQEVSIVNSVTPTLLLVPSTKGRGDARFLIKDLLAAATETRSEGLHFTHFGFLQGKFPVDEVSDVLTEILSPTRHVTLQRFVFDIDARAQDHLYTLLSPNNRQSSHV